MSDTWGGQWLRAGITWEQQQNAVEFADLAIKISEHIKVLDPVWFPFSYVQINHPLSSWVCKNIGQNVATATSLTGDIGDNMFAEFLQILSKFCDCYISAGEIADLFSYHYREPEESKRQKEGGQI